MSFMNTIKRKWHTLTHTRRLFWKKFAASRLFKHLPDRMAIEIIYHNVFGEKLDLNNQPIRDLRGTIWGIVSLLVLGWFSVLTLNNYFEADSSVYKNSNHYALRMDGIRLKQADKFIVAGAENNAFFDQKQFMGDIVIENVNDSSIQLGLQRFTHSFYQEFYNEDGRLDKLSLRNAESMFTFTNQDTLQFKMQNGSIYQFYVDELSEEDSVFYHLITPQGENLVSVEHRFLTRGLSLNTLLGGISCEDTDFSESYNFQSLPEYFKNALILLTKPKEVSYVDYCKELRCTDFTNWKMCAYWVKLADMKDHLCQKETLTDKLKEKYLEGLAELL